jgi:hypothetical protein
MTPSALPDGGGTAVPAVIRIQTACPGGWRDRNGRLSLCTLTAAGLGVLEAITADWVGLIPATGHQLNDPLLLSVSISSLLRGFTYFNWGALLITLVFPLLTGLLAWAALKALTARVGARVLPDEAARTARAAALLGMLPVFFQEIDGFQVLLFYALAAWASLYLSAFVARGISRV